MSSLARLLVSLAPTRLAQLCHFWGVTPRPAESLVATLYHEMTEDRSVARLVARLGEPERLVLDWLVGRREAAASGADLLHALPFPAERLEAILLALRESGLVAIASLDHLALAPTPRLHRAAAPRRAGLRGDWSSRWSCWVPSDLALVVRRARRQTAEEPGRGSLRRMLGALELPTLQRLALRWGVPAADRSFKRELVRALETRLAQRCWVARALGESSPAARLLYAAVERANGYLAGDGPEPLPLADAELQLAFDELSELFLLHESYADARRTLFIPAGVARSDAPPAPVALPELAEAGLPPQIVPPVGCLLGDLARLLAGARQAPLRRQHHETPVEPSADGQHEAGRPTPGPGGALAERQHYLLHACLTLGLLAPTAAGLAPTPAAAEWSALEPEAQVAALLRGLLAEERWWELGRGDPRRPRSPALARRRLASALADAEPGHWYTLSSLARRARSATLDAEPEGLPLEPAATPGSREFQGMLAAAFHWLGLVALGCNDAGRLVAVQLTPRGRRLLADYALPAAPR